MEEYVLSEEDERKVQLGEAAAALLDSPAYLLAIESIRHQCSEGILTSQPNEADARERLYNLSRGLSAVTEELLAMQSLGESTLENATRPTGDEPVQAEEPDEPADF